ncbi:hypothetical protein F4778DRAFT_229966 [Xylariomycetidae sp. FL2044]|nr:hypothetical protein F4778DRAFT_229966 [Xylariomycetidae sp. FL2044]
MALAVLSHPSPRPCSRSSSLHVPGNPTWATPVSHSSTLKLNRTDPDISLDGFDFFRHNMEEAWKTLDNIAALGLTLEDDGEEPLPSANLPTFSLEEGRDEMKEQEKPTARLAGPLHKWVNNLHRRTHRNRAQHEGGSSEPFPAYTFSNETPPGVGHRKSSSSSSFGFVAAVKSASVSLASASVVTRKRRRTARSSLHTRTDHSSRGSTSAPRFSEESACLEHTMRTDPGVMDRLLQRRRILEELISTEESYIGDIKFLMGAYVTVLASLPTAHQSLRTSISRNLTDILDLHEEILGELHRAVPDSEYTQPERISIANKPPPVKRHHRWRSLDSVPEDRGGNSWLQSIPSVIAEPNVAAQVARIFGKRVNRLFIYEEYGAKYEMMIKDVSTTHRTLSQWVSYQKGVETVAVSLGNSNHGSDHAKKSLTIGDLLVKPIQRICRYPLLFAELLKYTPVCDCPNSHMEIESVLIRLREATAEMNRATDNPQAKISMEQTWLLQDRLVFPDQRLDATSRAAIRSFGQVRLCGSLHVCWQTREGVNGQYMISLLYRDCLCLATAGKADQIYTIQACISLDCIRIEEVDNGRGLQCHTAPFSWKLVFECDHQLYEIIMTACSPREESQWRTHLTRPEMDEPQTSSEPVFYSSLHLNIKSLGTVFGKPGTVARRISIHRATTVGPKSPMCQVILKNTSALRESSAATSGSPINRSQSLLTTVSRVPILAPSRGDRARLEVLLADVWSRSVLPFPGIGTRARSEHLVRSSASTMIRKLSVASITNTFAKRSAGTSTVAKQPEGVLPRSNSFIDGLLSVASESSKLPPNVGHADDATCKQKLPVIRDTSERLSSPGASLPRVDASTLAGTVRRLDPTKLASAWNEESGSAVSVLRASSANSIKQTRPTPPPSAKSSPCLGEKENLSQRSSTRESVQESLSTVRPSYKRSRRSGINRKGLMGSSFRNFFR